VLISFVQQLAAILRDENQILHPDAESPGEINTGLNGKDHPGLRDPLIGAGNIALFMICLTDEMAGSFTVKQSQNGRKALQDFIFLKNFLYFLLYGVV